MNEQQLRFLLSTPPEQIVNWYKSKGLASFWNWNDLWQNAHNNSFTVAKAMKLDILQAIKDEVDKIFTQGITFEQFKKNLEPVLKRLGWWGKVKASDVPGFDPSSGIDPDKIVQLGSPQRLKTIYRVNSSVAYNANRYKSQLANYESRPYWLYVQLDRATKRKSHEPFHNKVFMYNDPIWDTIYPPNGWNCFEKNTQVATINGWQDIQSVYKGDIVLGGSGKYRLVNSVSKRKFDGNLIRFSTKDGSASSTPNHRILTLRGWIRAENLKVGDVIVQITEASLVNKIIGNVNHPDPAVSNNVVSLPVERETGIGNTLNAKFELRDKNVNPVRRTIKIKNRFITNSLKMSNYFLFTFGRLKCSIRMRRGIYSKPENFSLAEFFLNIFSECRTSALKFVSNVFHKFRILFSESKARMFVFLPMLFHKLTYKYRLFPLSFAGINPLRFYGFAPFARLNSKMFHQAHNSSDIHIPPSHKSVVAEEFFDVEDPEGFTGGAPLDLFDSIQSFQTWARLHCNLKEIISVSNIPYTDNVFNLSIDKDESYVIKLCVVHNCMCSVRALTHSQLVSMGLEVTNGNSVRDNIGDIPEEWRYNPGKDSSGPDLTKYDLDLLAIYNALKNPSSQER